MILLSAIHKTEDILEYKIYGSERLFNLKNISEHRDGIYKFIEPKECSENYKFMIEYSGNKETIIDNLQYEITHYILLQEKENPRYLIDKKLFDILFLKSN